METVTITINPEMVMYACLAVAILLMFYLKFKPDKPREKPKTRSSKKASQIQKEIKRLEKLLKD